MKLIKKWIDVNGSSLYVEYTTAHEHRPTIVFLHDSLGCVALWRDFPVVLADATYCNVLVYDRLGYGKSEAMPTHIRPVNYMEREADVLIDLLMVLEIEDAILFGHSDGGTIALLTAIKNPARIKSVICEAAHVFVEELTLKGISDAMEAYETTDLPLRLEKYHGSKVVTLFKAWSETWLRDDFRSWSIEHLLAGITCPLLFIQGDADEFGTLDQVDKTVRGVNGIAEEFVIPNVGHTPHKEVPDIVLEKTSSFILKLS